MHSDKSITPVSSDSDKTDNSPISTNEDHMKFNIKYEDLHFSKKSKLGSGATANVILVKYKDKPYALKVYEIFSLINIYKIIPLYHDDVQPGVIINEVKSLYESISCPYIIRFYEAFLRDASIQILLEFMDCGSLEDVYQCVGKIPENVLSEVTYQVSYFSFCKFTCITDFERFRLFSTEKDLS